MIATKTEHHLSADDLRAYVNDARDSAMRMASLFALVDGDLEEGDVSGNPAERRRDFNVTLARLVGVLEAIEPRTA